jgi:hypothetical protein
MHDPAADGARAAAQRLASVHGARLEADVEAALHSRGSDEAPPDQYIDPVAIASLIVAAASLAWTIYRDLRANHAAPPTPDHLIRRVRTTLRESRTLDDSTERVIEITVEETLKALPPTD